MWERIKKLLGKAFPAFERIMEFFGLILAIEGVKDKLGDIFHSRVRQLDKRGNYREFREAYSRLTPIQQEAIDELLKAMTNRQQERFQQEVALTGKTIDDSVILLQSLAGKTREEAMDFLKSTDCLQEPTYSRTAELKKLFVNDEARANFHSFMDEVEQDIAGLNPPRR